MEPPSTRQPAYALQPPPQPGRPPLPAWARVFRTVLLSLGGVVALLAVLFWSVSMTTQPSLYSDSGTAALQNIVWLGLALFLLAVPYVLASITYAVLWATSLRGRGYRSYAGTTWLLVLGPLAVVVPVVLWLGL